MPLSDEFNKMRHGAFLDKPGLEGETYLTRAVKMRAPEAIRDFITLGADPNAKNAKGEKPLYIALAERDEASIEILVAYGANVFEKVNGKTFRQHAEAANLPKAAEAARTAERIREAYLRSMAIGAHM